MYTGYINKNGKKMKVHISEYMNYYKVDGHEPLCFVCNTVVNVRNDSHAIRNTHFYHKNNSNCPTVLSSRERYLNLRYRSYDKDRGERIKKEVKNNLSKIYNACRKLCDGLYYYEFENLLLKASQRRMWDYANIELSHISYNLLTLETSFARTKGGRLKGVYFCFSNQHLGDRLWIEFDNKDLSLLKFEKSSKKLSNTIPVNDDFLNYDLRNKERFMEKSPNFLKAIF